MERNGDLDMQRVSPEARLLLLCTMPTPDRERAASIRILCEGGPDWTEVIRLAAMHKLRPLLFHSLREAAQDVVPTDVFDALRRHYHANVARNLFLTHTLVRLVERLRQEGIEMVPFKGPALAMMAYSDLGLREFADLDVLVSPQDVPRASHILQDAGFSPATVLSDWMIPMIAGKELEFHNDAMTLDLHWGVVPRRYFFLPVQFQSRVEMCLAGRPVGVFCVEDQLFLCAIHGTKDGWSGLYMLGTFAALIRSHPEIDWEWLFRQADRFKAVKLLSFALFLAQDVLGVSLPDAVRTHIAALPDRVAVKDGIVSRWFHPPTRAGVYFMTPLFFEWWVLQTPSDRLRALLLGMMLPTEKDMRRFRLPRALRGLYYLLHPLRLMADYGAGFLRMAPGSNDAGRSSSGTTRLN